MRRNIFANTSGFFTSFARELFGMLSPSWRRRQRFARDLYLEALECRQLLSGSPPTITAVLLPAPANGSLTLTAADFQNSYSDLENDPLDSIMFTGLPTDVSDPNFDALTLNINGTSAPITNNEVITADQLGDIVYSAPAGFLSVFSFFWQASDGTSFSDAASVDFGIELPHIIGTVTKTGAENQAIAFSASDFNDTNSTYSGAPLMGIQIQSLPQNGILELNGTPIVDAGTQSAVITLDQIGQMTYAPNAVFTGSDTFQWAAWDGTNFSSGAVGNGSDEVSLTVFPPPTIIDASKTLPVGTPSSFASTDFTNAYTGAPLQSITIVTLPVHGTLSLSGTPVTANQVVTSDQLANLTYAPATQFSGNDSFTWQATDGFNNSNVAHVNLTLTATLTGFAVSTDVNLSLNFSASQFTAADNGTLATLRISRLPSVGSLVLNGKTVKLNQMIPAAQLGSLAYKPKSRYKGADNFVAVANDGVNDSAPGTITLTVTTPSVGNFSSDVGENQPFDFAADDFSTFFSGAGSLTLVKVLSLPAHGVLTLASGTSSSPVTVNQVIAAANLANVVYTPANGFLGADRFKFTASDGMAFAAAPGTVTLTTRALKITGNGSTIENNSLTPNAGNFTDFGNFTINNALNFNGVTRTYTINNLTSGVSNLTDANTPVEITGANAADFIVTQAPGDALAAGASTTFTITFKPTVAGPEHATVTIPNGPGSSSVNSFSFAIQGTGLQTTNLIGPDNLSDNLLTSTTQAGKGAGATNGEILHILYTGTQLDGTVFDASSEHGNVPFVFRIDDSGIAGSNKTYPFIANNTVNTVLNTTVIDGWEYGLQGIKVGEHRTLIIPGSLAYGATADTTSALSGQTLIFDVVCAAIDDAPSWGVTNAVSDSFTGQLSAGASVLPGEAPSTANGTDFGTLTLGQTFVGQTFLGTDNSPDTSTGAPTAQIQNLGFKITGADAKDFVAEGNFSQFEIFFKPTAVGLRTATIHFLTNDPQHSDFAFNVQGMSLSPFTDLIIAGFNNTVFPATSTFSGVNTTIPVVIENFGNAPVPASTPATDITITVTNTATNTVTTINANTANTYSLAGLGPNKTRQINVPVVFPGNLTAANYTYTVSVNSSNAIAESVTSNNSSTASGYNLLGSLVSTTIPAVIAANGSINGNVVISIGNSGTFSMPSGETVSVQIEALGNGGTITLGPAQIFKISGLKASHTANSTGQSVLLTIPIHAPAIASAGSYQIQAVISPLPKLLETNASDNTFSTTANSLNLSFTVSS